MTRLAAPGHIWVCSDCGKTTLDADGIGTRAGHPEWSETCAANAVLCMWPRSKNLGSPHWQADPTVEIQAAPEPPPPPPPPIPIYDGPLNTEQQHRLAEWRRSFGIRLRQVREAAGLSQRELCRAIGISQNQLGKWESGYNSPHLFYFARICKALLCSPEVLLNIQERK